MDFDSSLVEVTDKFSGLSVWYLVDCRMDEEEGVHWNVEDVDLSILRTPPSDACCPTCVKRNS